MLRRFLRGGLLAALLLLLGMQALAAPESFFYFLSSPFAALVRYALIKPSRSPSMTA